MPPSRSLCRPVSLALRSLLAIACATLLVACASGTRRAPVEDRSARSGPGAAPPPSSTVTAPQAAEAKPVAGAENAGKPGYYTVKPGDTLIRIGLDTGQSWRDIQRWNKLDNPNLIEVGQVLRVLSPSVEATAVASKPVAASRVEARPLEGKPGATAPTASQPAAAASAAVPIAKDDDEPQWAWPAGGAVLAGFEEARNKGLSIGGKSGDPVLAAADGRVVYAGSGLRGYGNLVIVKHNATYLSAYAHNQTLLVKEDQTVKRGQKIAEMGSTDAERVQLHFEIRRQGKPVDPAKLLPSR